MIGLLPGHVKNALKPGLELQKRLVLVAHADYPAEKVKSGVHFSGILGDQFSLTSSGDNRGRLSGVHCPRGASPPGRRGCSRDPRRVRRGRQREPCPRGRTDEPTCRGRRLAAGTPRPPPAPWPPTHEPDGRERERHRMVESQIVRRGVEDETVLNAMRVVPRHLFVPKERQGGA